LFIAKKISPDANIGFYVGNLSPDGSIDEALKDKAHLYEFPDWEDALKSFMLNADTDYLKGMVLHMFADKKFHTFWNENTSMPYQEEKEFWERYMDENRKINSYAFHNTEWAYSLFEKMEKWDFNGFVETEYIKQEDVKWYIPWMRERYINTNLVTSASLPSVKRVLF